MTRVLPLPAPATISRGPSTCVTASRWASVRSFNNSSVDTTARVYGRGSGGWRVEGGGWRVESKSGGGACYSQLPTLHRRSFRLRPRLQLVEELHQCDGGVVVVVVAGVEQGEGLADASLGQGAQGGLVLALGEVAVV